ncbi:DNA polymerase III subunit alpha [Buchnera aphidicola]|uniref:DNA polymerase III subunit alpha n=1 Tax=Buchnera aphidicola (Cinara strobi) TaxID=1921549 RepID=A0A3B1E9F6_9GAMM|nr:DNA polymerase III subunit alpha [Buchnera aphidicola]VAX76469.1 DNA polymerase III subunit alpha [Buchnera aphidicola (Cinara strobi)]
MNSFVHIRSHSDFSMIDGLVKPEKLIECAKKMNMMSLGMTDVNNLHGVIKFYSSACRLGIKPIIGIDVLVSSQIIDNFNHNLTLLALDNKGYNNIIELLSESYQSGYDDRGLVIKMNHLLCFKKGLLILSGGMSGDIGKCIFDNDIDSLNRCIVFYKKYFPNKFYLEISRLEKPYEEEYIRYIKYISSIHSIPVVATNEVLFLKSDDFNVHKIKVAVYKKQTIMDKKFIYPYTKNQFFKSQQDMIRIFSDFPESIINGLELVKRCNVIIPSGSYFLPIFPTGSLDPYNFFVQKSIKGLKIRLRDIFPDKKKRNKIKKIYFSRLRYELLIIKKMGFVSYFLIVMEFIQWAKINDIPVGPGRGSGSGSLVAFSLNITEIDPLQFDLLFERFLNPDRVSLPDFDIDFCMDKRDLVIDHVSRKYGKKSVAQIVTFGTMAAKAVIRDVGRVLGYPYGLINKISKLVPLDSKMNLKKAFSIQKELIDLYHHNHDIKKLIDIAKKLEGVTRNIGKHAGGVVIAPTKLSDFVPIICDSFGSNQITQFDKNDIEYVGLVKFDFLGLKTLTMIDSTIKMINKTNRFYKKKELCLNKINLSDKKSFLLLNKSETTSIFQLESIGMRSLIKRLKPDSFEDIIALVALYRPGPLQSGMVDNFINRKHGYEVISYPDSKWQHKLLKPILKSTYGIVVYQEQVMKIAQTLSNFSPSEADILRRAMAKKNPKEMAQQRKLFQLGAVNNFICPNLSKKIFDLLEKFSAYGFNKSHSTTYALLAYQTLWLKANYAPEFMASAMTLDMTNTNKIVNLIYDSRRMKLKIIPPNINISYYSFSVNSKREIIYGLGAIKGLGKASIDIIISERRNNSAPFTSFLDLCVRLCSKKITRHIFEILVMSGTCDCFKVCRIKLFQNIEYFMKVAKQKIIEKESQQNDLFQFNDFLSSEYLILNNNTSNFDNLKFYHLFLKTLKWEKETLGLYLTGHPIKNFLNEISYYTNGVTLNQCVLKNQTCSIVLAGMVFAIKIAFTKKRKKFYIITLDDSYSRLDVFFFTNTHSKIDFLFNQDNMIVVLQGKISFDSFTYRSRVLVNKIYNLEKIRSKKVRRIKIFIKNQYFQNYNIFDLLNNYLQNRVKKGDVVVCFLARKKKYMNHKLFNSIYTIYPDNNFLNYLKIFSKKIIIKLNFFK